MNHPKQHGGWAQAAQKRGETFVRCNTCGGPRHPRPLFGNEPEHDRDGWALVRMAVGLSLFLTAFIWMLLLVQP